MKTSIGKVDIIATCGLSGLHNRSVGTGPCLGIANDNTHCEVGVPANVLGGRVNNNVDADFKWFKEKRRGPTLKALCSV